MGKIDDARRQLLERVNTEGVLAAYEAALAVCRDTKAPAPARATASAVIFRVAGLFDRREAVDHQKQPFEMTGDELAEAIKQAERSLSERPATDGEPDIFE